MGATVPADNASGSRTNAAHMLLLAAVVAVCYFQTTGYGFVTDDFGLYADNPNAKDWGRLGRIFTTGYWDAEGGTGGLYRPIAILSFLIEHTVAGLSPRLSHIDNALLHFICTVLVYFILKEVYRDTKAPFFAALLFAAHPVHVEAVTWISGRAELLWAAFGLGSMLAFIKLPAKPRSIALWGGLYLLGLLSKESVVVIPVMLAAYILLYDGVAGHGSITARLRAIVKRLWPYAAITAAYLPVRLWVLGAAGPRETEQALYGVSGYGQFLTMCRALYEYVRIGLVPTGLKAAYLFHPPSSILDPRVVFALVSVASMAVFARRIASFSRPGYLAAAWFIIALIPVSNVVPTGVIMSERAMYVPVLGACMVIAMLAVKAGGLLQERTGKAAPLSALLVVPVLGLFIAGTVQRNPVWESQEVFGRAYVKMMDEYIKARPDDESLYRHLAGTRLRFFGYTPETEKAIAEADSRMDTDDDDIRYMRAFSLLKQKRADESYAEIMHVIDKGAAADKDYYLAAGALTSMNRYDDALRMLDIAVGMNPNKSDYRMLKGQILMEMGEDDAALSVYEQVSAIDPENHDALLMQGIILDSKMRFPEAVARIRAAVALRPEIPDLHYFLAVAYLDAGDPASAVPELEKAIAIKPDYAEAAGLLSRIK